MPVYRRAWDVLTCLGKWKGKIDTNDEDVVLGMEFLAKVRPFTVSDGMLTITSKGSEVGIKLAQGMERDVRISSMKAWWTRRQERQRNEVMGKPRVKPHDTARRWTKEQVRYGLKKGQRVYTYIQSAQGKMSFQRSRGVGTQTPHTRRGIEHEGQGTILTRTSRT
ncbi:U8 snoRNA-decapping enzyme [Bienertia sinuspersici]